ncbi:hypothetical protein H0H92_013532, partial [Tricholoma furcatifolium]
PTDPLKDLPVGALIHALQAVEHSLNEYRTGTRIIDKTPQGFYLADNYGDKELEKKDENGRMFIEKTSALQSPWSILNSIWSPSGFLPFTSFCIDP